MTYQQAVMALESALEIELDIDESCYDIRELQCGCEIWRHLDSPDWEVVSICPNHQETDN